MSKATRDLDVLTVRLPMGMLPRVRQRAAANRRSMNSEIVHYLDRALAEETKSPAAAPTAPGHDHSAYPGKEKSNDE